MAIIGAGQIDKHGNMNSGIENGKIVVAGDQIGIFGVELVIGGDRQVRLLDRPFVGGEELLALFEERLDFFQRQALGFLRFAAQARFHKFQVLQNHVRPAFHRHQDGVGINQLVLAHHVHLRVGFLVRLDQFVRLIEARVFEVVFAGFYSREAEQRYFHKY